MNNEYEVYRTNSLPEELKNHEDPFVYDVVVNFWQKYDLEGTIYYIKDRNQIVSFILLEQDNKRQRPDEWTIRGTWTHPRYRKQGLSSTILYEIKQDYGESVIDYIWVNITPGAENFYLDNNFRLLGKRLDTSPPMSVGVYTYLDSRKILDRFLEKYPNHDLQ